MDLRKLPLARSLSLIFDLDGVIVDSMPLHTLAWKRYLKKLGANPEDVAERMHGRRNDEIVRDFLGAGVSEDLVFEHGAAKERLFREMMAGELFARLVPGVKQFLERTEGIPVALATNAEPANVDFTLDHAGLRPWFHAVADGTQVSHAKPSPDIYLLAAAKLGTPPGNCIVFEDSPVGITAARAAGMRVVGVRTHSGALDNVDVSIENFLDPELERWLATQSPR
jgi:beta-phosphoglucomutase